MRRSLLALTFLVGAVFGTAGCDTPRDYECKAIWERGHEVVHMHTFRFKEMRKFSDAVELCERRVETQDLQPEVAWTKFECHCVLPAN